MRYAAGRRCGATTARKAHDVAASEHPNVDRPTDEMVDVLIIGAGASGAVVAWSLAETRTNIRPTGATGKRGATAISTSARTGARATPTIPSTTKIRR